MPPASSPEVHQLGQSLLVADLTSAVSAHAWPTFDPAAIEASLPRLLAVILALIRGYGGASASHATTFYAEQRRSAGIPGRPPVRVPPDPPTAQVAAQIKWAVGGLYGDVQPTTLAAAQSNVARVTETLVLDKGRTAILDAVAADKVATGWARVPEAGACSFCLLLATRGAVYKSEASSAFDAHNGCHCHIEPLFAHHYEPTAQVRAAQALYRATPNGNSPATARNNFRVALQQERDAGRA